jgi:hypothetical protein
MSPRDAQGCKKERSNTRISQYQVALGREKRFRTHVDDTLRELAAVLLLHVLNVSLVLGSEVLGVEESDND